MSDFTKNLVLLNCDQGSEEWHFARTSIPTASRFSDIVTSQGKACKSKSYLYELISESINGVSQTYKSKSMQAGNDKEPKARSAYEFETGNEVIEVGGVFLDESKTIMASPDGLIQGQKKGLEIKCPELKNHIKYCFEDVCPTEYLIQVMGGIWVTNYDSWDFVSYCPEYRSQPLFIKNVLRDEKLIKAMDKEIRAFSKTLEIEKQKLLEAA